MSKKSLFEKVEDFAKKQNLIKSNEIIVVGYSGGPDSTFILHFLKNISKKYDLKLIAAHLDHEWRPESKKDVKFCESEAKKLGVEFISARASEVTDQKLKGSKEEIGRILRRKFFGEVMKKHGANEIALAHHIDDQQETFFIRLMRGAGVTGLSAMRPREGAYIRPLINLTKKEIVDFLNSEKIKYLSDPSNQKMEFLRNRIRVLALPALKKCDDRFNESLNRTMQRLQEADDFIKNYVQKKYDSILSMSGNKKWFDTEKLFKEKAYIQKQLIMLWLVDSGVSFTPSYGLFEEIIRFFKNNKSLEHTLYNTFKIRKKQNLVTITSK